MLFGFTQHIVASQGTGATAMQERQKHWANPLSVNDYDLS